MTYGILYIPTGNLLLYMNNNPIISDSKENANELLSLVIDWIYNGNSLYGKKLRCHNNINDDFCFAEFEIIEVK